MKRDETQSSVQPREIVSVLQQQVDVMYVPESSTATAIIEVFPQRSSISCIWVYADVRLVHSQVECVREDLYSHSRLFLEGEPTVADEWAREQPSQMFGDGQVFRIRLLDASDLPCEVRHSQVDEHEHPTTT